MEAHERPHEPNGAAHKTAHDESAIGRGSMAVKRRHCRDNTEDPWPNGVKRDAANGATDGGSPPPSQRITRDLFAGLMAGLIPCVALHPLEVCKVHLQRMLRDKRPCRGAW